MPCDRCESVPTCPECDGCFPRVVDGEDRNACPRKCRCVEVPCGFCDGTGRVPERSDDLGHRGAYPSKCPFCDGDGVVFERAKKGEG